VQQQTSNNILSERDFQRAAHLKAIEEALKSRGHFQHLVGMAVHDVGRILGLKLQSGMIFTIDPMIWIHKEDYSYG
jgi:Xaa-Pro aminopeptidase